MSAFRTIVWVLAVFAIALGIRLLRARPDPGECRAVGEIVREASAARRALGADGAADPSSEARRGDLLLELRQKQWHIPTCVTARAYSKRMPPHRQLPRIMLGSFPFVRVRF